MGIASGYMVRLQGEVRGLQIYVEEGDSAEACIEQDESAAEEVDLAGVEGHVERHAEFLEAIDDLNGLPERDVGVVETLQEHEGALYLFEVLDGCEALVELGVGDGRGAETSEVRASGFPAVPVYC